MPRRTYGNNYRLFRWREAGLEWLLLRKGRDEWLAGHVEVQIAALHTGTSSFFYLNVFPQFYQSIASSLGRYFDKLSQLDHDSFPRLTSLVPRWQDELASSLGPAPRRTDIFPYKRAICGRQRTIWSCLLEGRRFNETDELDERKSPCRTCQRTRNDSSSERTYARRSCVCSVSSQIISQTRESLEPAHESDL